VGGFVATWRDSVFSPRSFFRSMPVEGGAGAAVVYFLIVGILASAVEMFWQLTLIPALGAEEGSPLAVLMLGQDESPLLSFLLSPIYLLLSLGVATVIVHVALWITGGARRGMATTLRVIAFSYGPQLFVIVPVLGTLVGSVWILWLSIVGLREAHGTDTWRAAIAVLLPFFALLGILLLLALALMAGGAGVLPGMPGIGPG
jgi:hypothetical protein